MSRERQIPDEVARARELRRLAGFPASLTASEVIGPVLRILQTSLEHGVQVRKDAAATPAA